jgi:hypothetical protein
MGNTILTRYRATMGGRVLFMNPPPSTMKEVERMMQLAGKPTLDVEGKPFRTSVSHDCLHYVPPDLDIHYSVSIRFYPERADKLKTFVFCGDDRMTSVLFGFDGERWKFVVDFREVDKEPPVELDGLPYAHDVIHSYHRVYIWERSYDEYETPPLDGISSVHIYPCDRELQYFYVCNLSLSYIMTNPNCLSRSTIKCPKRLPAHK